MCLNRVFWSPSDNGIALKFSPTPSVAYLSSYQAASKLADYVPKLRRY